MDAKPTRSSDDSSEGVGDAGPEMAADDDVRIAHLLAEAGRLLLEYNESTATIHRLLSETCKTLTGKQCSIDVSYGSVTVSTAGGFPVLRTVSELRYNTALLAQVREIFGAVRARELGIAESLERLQRLEVESPPHPVRIAVPVLGIAAASLSRLLGADIGGVLVAGGATALGLVIRRWLGRRGHSPLTLALVAALMGAGLGGIAFQFGWTRTPEIAIVVPALMVIPGPHLINGLLDLVDNHVPMSMARLWLAGAILLAGTVGLVVGIELALPETYFLGSGDELPRPPFLFGVVLSGIVACGFAVFYNAAWRQVGLAAVTGIAGNALRDLALFFEVRLDAATLIGGLAIGMVSAAMALYVRAPVAIIAYAGAVTMLPGTLMYQTLGGMLRLARLGHDVDAAAAGDLIARFGQMCLIVSGLAFGLILGARGVGSLLRVRATRP